MSLDMDCITHLAHRGVIEITGEDRAGFLQGLVSNDVAQVAPGHAVWAALLTPQGKWLAEFFVLAHGDVLLLECERDQAQMLVRHLGRYRLRAKVMLRDASAEWEVYAAWGAAAPAKGLVFADPRLPEAGWRILSPETLPATAPLAAWDAHRIALGLPDGSRDLEAEKTVLLEAGFDELGGVSWSKGCYMGQELTARTKYRGLVKRRLVPVAVEGELPAPGTPVLRETQEVGTIRSGVAGMALAALRLEAIGAESLSCGVATLRPRPPSWLKLPAAAPG